MLHPKHVTVSISVSVDDQTLLTAPCGVMGRLKKKTSGDCLAKTEIAYTDMPGM